MSDEKKAECRAKLAAAEARAERFRIIADAVWNHAPEDELSEIKVTMPGGQRMYLQEAANPALDAAPRPEPAKGEGPKCPYVHVTCARCNGPIEVGDHDATCTACPDCEGGRRNVFTFDGLRTLPCETCGATGKRAR